jgi:invasion protein IalB
MAINVGQPFKRTSPAPIDESLVLTKLQMLSVDDGEMPELYFAICLDDGCLYFYNKSATPNAETGKYTKQSTQGVAYTAGQGIDISDSDEISVDTAGFCYLRRGFE